MRRGEKRKNEKRRRVRRGEKRKEEREKRSEKRKKEENIRINSRLVYTPTCTSMKLY